MFFFFFQAEDGIRDGRVTGVQTCALPIFVAEIKAQSTKVEGVHQKEQIAQIATISAADAQIGRASCRESVDLGGRRSIKKKKKKKKNREQEQGKKMMRKMSTS